MQIILVILEATGAFERELLTNLVANGLNATAVNPRQTRDLTKTDAVDARIPARIAQLQCIPTRTPETNETFKAFFDRLIAKGKKYKVALVAAMRKLLTVLNSMLKTRWNQHAVPVRKLDQNPAQPLDLQYSRSHFAALLVECSVLHESVPVDRMMK